MSQDMEAKSGNNLVSEFKERFGSHPIRIERFKITQSSKIAKTSSYLMQEIGADINQEKADLISLIFEFLVAEDLYHETVLVFIDDFRLISKYFGYEFDSSNEEILIEKVVTPYLQNLKFQTDIYFDLSRWLIQRIGQGWDDSLARSYALNDFLKPLMKTIIEKFSHVNLKFLGAMAWTTLERYTTKSSGNQVKLEDKLKILQDEYPDLEGSKFAYDLAFMYLLKPNWEFIMDMIGPEIAKLKENLKIERENMQREQVATKAAKEATAKADPVDDAKNKVSMKLNELFGFKYDWNINRESQIEKAMSLLMRRISLKVFGHVAAEDFEPIKKEIEEFLWPEMIEYPEIMAQGINVKGKFYDPTYKESDEILEEFNEKGKAYYDEKFKDKFFSKLFQGYRGGADYETISKNLIEILKLAKENEPDKRWGK